MKNNFAVFIVSGIMGFFCSKFYRDYKDAMEDLITSEQENAVLTYENEQLRKALRKAKKEK